MVITEFSTKTVARIVGVTARQLDYWADTGFIVPSIQEGAGRGKVRLYSFVDLVQVKVAKRLGDAGISLQKMRKAVATLRTYVPESDKPLAQFEFVSDGKEIYVAYDEERMVVITSKIGQFYWRLKVGDIVNELVERVQSLASVEQLTVAAAGGTYPVTVHQDLESGWWIGRCPSIKGCVTQGETREELLVMLKDAISECAAVLGDDQPAAGHA